MPRACPEDHLIAQLVLPTTGPMRPAILRDMPSPEDIATAERALEFARHDLLSSGGNPAWAALAVLDGGGFHLGPLIVASREAARAQHAALHAAAPGATVLIVGYEQAGQHLRFTVLDEAGARLVVRDQTRDEPIGSRNEEI